MGILQDILTGIKDYRGYRALQHEVKSRKSIITTGDAWLNWQGTESMQTSFNKTKYGAAQAYLNVQSVFAATNAVVDNIASLKWQLVHTDNNNEENIIVTSDDARSNHPFAVAMRRFKKQYNQSLIEIMEYDYLMYGEIYLELYANEAGYNRSIEWLNPLGVNVMVDNERIYGYRYGWAGNYATYSPEQIRYLHTRHPIDDYIGYGLVVAALDKVLLTKNFERMVNDFFRNNARPGAIVRPVDADQAMSERDVSNLEKIFREQLKGLGGMFSTIISRVPLQVDTFDNPDLTAQYQLTQSQNDEIFEIFRVPRAMLGNTTNQPYKNGDETTRQFYLSRILPDAKRHSDFINEHVLPYFDPRSEVTFQFDTSFIDDVTEADALEAQIVNGQLSGGYLSVAEAARLQERPVEGWMEGRYMYNGMPMTVAQIDQWINAAIQPQPQYPMFNTSNVVQGRIAERAQPAQLPQPQAEKAITCDCEGDCIHKAHIPLYDHDTDLFPSEAEIQTRIYGELKKWQTFELRHFGKSNRRWFEPSVIPPTLASIIIDIIDEADSHEGIRKAFNRIESNHAYKTITSYARNLRELALGFWRGIYTKQEFSSIMRDVVEREYKAAWNDGLKRAGVTMDDLSDAEANILADLISGEQVRVADLANDIEGQTRDNKNPLAPLRNRLELWAQRYTAVEERGFVVGSKDKKLMWKFDIRKEHCSSCQALHGQVRKASYWQRVNIMPKSARLECFGLHCGCKFVEAGADAPLSKGRLPRVGWRA